jgi:hypothetical protein
MLMHNIVLYIGDRWLVQEGESDFDKPWGLEPPMSDLEGRLRVFYAIHNPENVM